MDKKDYRVFVLMGDGELAEGSIWEGAMAAAHYGLDNLVGIVDRNRLQISGDTESVMQLESLKEKWTGFGWMTYVIDGHDMRALLEAFNNIPRAIGKPTLYSTYNKGQGCLIHGKYCTMASRRSDIRTVAACVYRT